MKILEFLKEYGSLINIGLFSTLLSIVAYVAKMIIDIKSAQNNFYKEKIDKIILEKEEQIKTLKERISLEEKNSLKNVNQEIESAKSFFETKLYIEKEKWLEASKPYIETQTKEIKDKLWKEIEIREQMVVKQNSFEYSLKNVDSIAKSKVSGKYSILGHNPDRPHEQYYGILTIKFEKEHIRAVWEISETQKQVGYGFKMNNHIIISFSYLDDKDGQRVGIVGYEFINEKIMRGKWTLKHLPFLGFEECRKLEKEEFIGDTWNKKK